MGIIIFVVVLAVLILSHEFGHFIVAKKSGIRVDEFGIGFPPRIWGKRVGETIYSINWLPFGGFVKIFGENNEEILNGEDGSRSFVRKSKWVQAAVIAAGIIFNLILAWIIFSFVLTLGMPVSSSFVPANKLHSVELVVVGVAPNSPAENAGLKAGDKITYMEAGKAVVHDVDPDDLREFVAAHADEEITFQYLRGEETGQVKIHPEKGVYGDKPAIGISMDLVGVYEVKFWKAPLEGFMLTSRITLETIKGYASIIKNIFVGEGKSVLASVSGPVGIAGLVGNAASEGFVPVLILTAIISISLAIINLIPFPALDGGRLLFLIIEAIKGSPIKPKVTAIINTTGFAILLILILIVTASDILKLIK